MGCRKIDIYVVKRNVVFYGRLSPDGFASRRGTRHKVQGAGKETILKIHFTLYLMGASH
jgi:hypothetical protein